LKAAKAETDLDDAVLVGEGKLEGQDVVAAVQDFRFMGGSLGMAEAVVARHDAGRGEGHPLHPTCCIRWCTHAGGHFLPDANAPHHHCRAEVALEALGPGLAAAPAE